ncbi:MAG: hypothetical protein E7358_00635 [Clostridiales bacterium]|nr:hypothetical protein [Clostridiales bacterium]
MLNSDEVDAIKLIVKTMMTVTLFSCIERLLGFIYRIYLSRYLGSEGLGIYQVSLSVVGLIMTLTSSGIPITVSRIMIKHKAQGLERSSFNTVTAGMLTSLILSIPIVLIIYIFPSVFSFIFADDRCYALLKIMLPGVVITSVYAVIRGYFWGEKKFFTYSIIEFLEEAIMLVAGVLLISKATDNYSKIEGACNAVLISYIFSFATAFLLYFLRGGKIKNPKGELKPLIVSSTPITLMRTSNSLINTLIAIILPLRLVLSGMTESGALASFGELSGMSIPLINMPSTIIGSIALVLVPELSDNFYRHSDVTLKNNVEKAIKSSVFISCMIIPIFLSVGKELGTLVYHNQTAGIYVQRASIIMLPMSVTMITTSMLNSLNLERKTLLYYLVGASFLLLSIYFLPKYLGIYSLIIGLLLSYLTTSICNLILIKKTCNKKPKLSLFLIASVLIVIPSGLISYLLKGILLPFLPLGLTVLFCSVLAMLFSYALFSLFNLFSVKEDILK